MRYTRLSTYEITNGTFDELTGIVEKDLLPLFAKEPGFVDYGIVDFGNNKAMAISIWETREQAQQSASMAASWTKDNVADKVRLVSTQIGGLALFRGAPVAA